MVSSQNIGSCSLVVTCFSLGPVQDELGLMVSVPQSPWLGANAKPPEEHGVPKGKPQTLGPLGLWDFCRTWQISSDFGDDFGAD